MTRPPLPSIAMIGRFGVTGALSSLTHAGVAHALYLGGAAAAASSVAGFCIATLVSYTLHALWSFSTSMSKDSLKRFLLVACAGAAASGGVAHAAELLGMPHWVGIGAVLLVVPPITFLGHSFWTFRGRKHGPGPAQVSTALDREQ